MLLFLGGIVFVSFFGLDKWFCDKTEPPECNDEFPEWDELRDETEGLCSVIKFERCGLRSSFTLLLDALFRLFPSTCCPGPFVELSFKDVPFFPILPFPDFSCSELDASAVVMSLGGIILGCSLFVCLELVSSLPLI